MLSEVMDIECLSNFFSYTGYCRQTKEYHQFVIHDSRNDYETLIKHLFRDKLIMIGYNNDAYDYVILHHMINHYDMYCTLSGFDLSQRIYQKSQEVINEKFTAVADWNKKIIQIDLFKIWHYDNLAKSTSLKALEISMNLDNVEDMPFTHEHWIQEEDIQSILAYNKNDVIATNKFLDITLGYTDHPLYKGKNKIELRQTIAKKYGINCLNWNDIKIGLELILKLYSSKFNKNSKDIRKLRTYRKEIDLSECIPNWIKFNSKEFNVLLNNITNSKILNTKGEFKYSVIFHGMKFDYGTGGIHSSIKQGVYKSDNEWCIIDYDVNSLYPSIAIALGLYPEHLGPEFLQIYGDEIVSVRLAEKEKPKDKRDNVIIEGYKLAANGFYGKTNSEDSYAYDPLYTLKTTIAGQLFVSMWIERLVIAIPECIILQSNTDGVTVKLKRKDLDKYRQIIKDLTDETGLTFEENEYSLMVINDVNNYIAQYTTGKSKYKGLFEIDKELHKDPSMRIVPLALSEYFLKGISISETIKNHKNIYDFCLRLKVNFGWRALYKFVNSDKLETKILSKNTRYYISNSGGALYKHNISDNRTTGVNVGFVTTVFNHFEKKEMKNYNINYDFYIKECKKIIDSIENKQLSLF